MDQPDSTLSKAPQFTEVSTQTTPKDPAENKDSIIPEDILEQAMEIMDELPSPPDLTEEENEELFSKISTFSTESPEDDPIHAPDEEVDEWMHTWLMERTPTPSDYNEIPSDEEKLKDTNKKEIVWNLVRKLTDEEEIKKFNPLSGLSAPIPKLGRAIGEYKRRRE